MAEILLTEITEGKVDGNGVFDKLMAAGKDHIQQEFEAQRLRGTDYANVYLGMVQSAMTQAIQFSLGKQAADKQAELLTVQATKAGAENLLLTQKTATEEAQTMESTTRGTTPGLVTGMVGKQKALIEQQTQGFVRDAEQKASKIMMDSFAIRRSTDSAELPPTKAENTDIDQFLDSLAAGVGITTLSQTSYSVSGVMSGLTGSGCVLQIAVNGGAPTGDLAVAADGVFTFAIPFLDTQTYAVTVLTQPSTPTQVVSIQQGTGTIDGANVNNVLATAV